MMKFKKRVRIGDMLLNNGLISQEQLDAALIEQKNSGRKLGSTLIHLGFVDEDQMLNLLAQQFNIPYIDLGSYKVKDNSIELLTEVHARRYRAIVIDRIANEYLVGISDPTDIQGIDELSSIINHPTRFAVVRESDLLRTIDLVYRRTHEIGKLAEELDEELKEDTFDVSHLDTNAEQSDAPIVRLLSTIFEDALQVSASDIHIEPDEKVVRIRQRVDGVLQEHVMKETRIVPALVLKLKLMANLDISEKRLPQDGRFNIVVKGQSIDVRLSTMPVQYGEAVVMRLLNQSATALNMSSLGMPEHILHEFNKLIHRPHGMLLVTGPTGSGKTTTLYAALNELNSSTKKIITAEDPVEYRLERISQVQVNHKIGLTFASVLRAVLRQDPDIVMVGEMRDQETVEIGLRAAMTGHLVLSTLHTNDAISSALRLQDMGVESYLAATALRGVIAQRLVRKICHHCITPYTPTTQEWQWIEFIDTKEQMNSQTVFSTGRGCPQCNHSGYRGRIGVYELLVMDDDLVETLRNNDHSGFSQAAKKSQHYAALSEMALQYATQGLTTLEEVFRVTEAIEDNIISKPRTQNVIRSSGNELTLEDIEVVSIKESNENNNDYLGGIDFE